jgi:hypothetical protein
VVCDDPRVTTWIFTPDQIDAAWRATRDVWGNKLWYETMLYEVIPAEWQQEVRARSGRDFREFLDDAVGDLAGDDPSLVFLAMLQAFGAYGITVEFPPHPVHGDVLALAARVAPDTWTLPEDAFYELCAALHDDGDGQPPPDVVVEIFADCLSPQRQEEIERRSPVPFDDLVRAMLADVTASSDPEVLIDAFARRLAGLGITLRFRGVEHILPERLRSGT